MIIINVLRSSMNCIRYVLRILFGSVSHYLGMITGMLPLNMKDLLKRAKSELKTRDEVLEK